MVSSCWHAHAERHDIDGVRAALAELAAVALRAIRSAGPTVLAEQTAVESELSLYAIALSLAPYGVASGGYRAESRIAVPHSHDLGAPTQPAW